MLAPYSQNKAIRFHALQSLILVVAVIAVQIVFSIFLSVLHSVMFFGGIFVLLTPLLNLAVLALFVVMAPKAFQGQTLELPFVSQFARQMV